MPKNFGHEDDKQQTLERKIGGRARGGDSIINCLNEMVELIASFTSKMVRMADDGS